MELESSALLQNYYQEAGLHQEFGVKKMAHGGWEDPSCQLRGHFLGHWLSAAALRYNEVGDEELLSKANSIVHELKICQTENGGQWAAAVPEKIVSETIQDLHSETLTSAELRAKTKAAMRNPTEMQNIGLIAGAIHGDVSAFNEIVKELYDAEPDETNIKAYKKYTDIVDSLSHKGVLTNAEVENLISKIADYYRDKFNPNVKEA